MIRRALLVIAFLAVSNAAYSQCTPTHLVFAGGAFTYSCAAAGGDVTVPNVVGLSLSAADTALEAATLDTGATTPQCSAEAADQVLGQTPIAGAMVSPGSLVDLVHSNGTLCPQASGRGTKIHIGIGIGVTL